MRLALNLHKHGIPVVGVPKTIDNDLAGTNVTFGFHTAVDVATAAIERLHSTADAHDRIFVVELMGRYAGLDRPVCRCRGHGPGHTHPGDPRTTSSRSANT